MKISATQILSYNAKRALVRGIIIGIVTTIVYLAVVVITTPNLPAIAASSWDRNAGFYLYLH
jgi:hypothetical protein